MAFMSKNSCGYLNLQAANCIIQLPRSFSLPAPQRKTGVRFKERTDKLDLIEIK
jgi:hypothetical protein